MTDKEIMSIVRGFTKGILGGNTPQSKCYMVCAPLYSYLCFLGIDVELVEGTVNSEKYIWGHFWLKLKDGKIIDPTAGQFNILGGLKIPKIYFGDKPNNYKEKKHKYKK